jgi:hypothetical protein
MKRRGFLGFLSGGAIWPLVAAAQQTPKIPKDWLPGCFLSYSRRTQRSSFQTEASRTWLFGR